MGINKNLILAFIALILSVFAITSSLSGGGSVIAGLTLRVIPMLVILCLLNAKLGYMLLAISVCFVDYIKRLMILDNAISSVDIGYILVVPAAITGALMIPAIGKLFANRRSYAGVYKIFWLIVLWNVVVTALLAASGDINSRGIQQAMNVAVFAHLVWLIPFWYKQGWSRAQLIAPFLGCGIIVAIYGISQAIFGITKLEYDYIMSGYTMLIGEWRDTWMRPFSTLSSVHGYSMTMAILFWLAVYMKKLSIRKVFWTFMIIITFGAVMSSMVRTAWLAWGLVIPLAYLLRKRWCIPVLYTSGVVVFVGLMTFSGEILRNLDYYQDQVEEVAGYSNTKLGRVAQVSSYSERLQGFNNLKINPDMRTMFGYKGDKGSEDLKSHDPITSSMRDFGVIPVGIGLLFIAFVFNKLVKSVHSIPDIDDKNVCAFLLALTLSVMLTSAVSGGHLTVSPINVYWYLILGFYFVEFSRSKKAIH